MPRPKHPAILVERARTHNLKGIDCQVPHRAVTVVTGPSGAGKSSLAFDTIFAEGQRRFVESMSTYARQFLDQMERPPVDAIDNILPAVALEAKNAVRNARSTVGTITETLDVMRLLFTHLGEIGCVNGHGPVPRLQPRGGGGGARHRRGRRLLHPGRAPAAAEEGGGRRPRRADPPGLPAPPGGGGGRAHGAGREVAGQARSPAARPRPLHGEGARPRRASSTRWSRRYRMNGGRVEARGPPGCASTAASSPARSAARRRAGPPRPCSPSTPRSAPARSARGSAG